MYQNIFISDRTPRSPATVYLWDDEQGLQVLPYKDFNYSYIESPHGVYTSIDGKKLKKLGDAPYGMKGLYESDVSRETRVLTDVYLNSDTPSTGHRILTIDIEVSSVGGFASPTTADKEVTAIAFHDSQTKRYIIYLLDKDQRISSATTPEYDLISCVSEDTLLMDFLAHYEQIRPTIITGWNTDKYDIPYLYHRLNRLYGEDVAARLSPIGKIKFNPNRQKYQIAGVSSLDYLELYQKYTYTQQPNYRLDTIGRIEVGMGKVEYEGTLDMLYRNDLEKFIAYNLNDVQIVVALDAKMKLIELIRFICHLGHVPYEDFAYSSKFIEGTILTYLHRKGVIAPNKPEGGREEFNRQQDSNEDGFAGAFVKDPNPGLYEWVYSLDLQSLYPSIIMSLNISPETKVARVPGWDVDRYTTGQLTAIDVVGIADGITQHMDMTQFATWMSENSLNVSSNGIVYRTDRLGIIPEILDKWFKERVEFKNLMKQHTTDGNAELADFYDRRQHVQKILLNSIYGVLGLPIFRFYDVDNALAVTATGQTVIKSTAKFINHKYKKLGVSPRTKQTLERHAAFLREWYPKEDEFTEKSSLALSPDDHCIYIDTDSVYFSTSPLGANGNAEEQKQFTIAFARETEAQVNKFYDFMAQKLFFCHAHRFVIKGESILRTAFWVRKKRYAMKKIFDLETNKDVDKLTVKGLDVVRSMFPPAFQVFMKGVLNDVLNRVPKAEVDAKVLEFRETIPTLPFAQIARNTAIKNISEYEKPNAAFLEFPKGTPAHVKAAILYNRLLTYYGVEKEYPPIRDGDKIKYVMLKPNPLMLETMALKTYEDPPQIVELVNTYIDHHALFERELSGKLAKFYESLDWGDIPTDVNQSLEEFFTFG